MLAEELSHAVHPPDGVDRREAMFLDEPAEVPGAPHLQNDPRQGYAEGPTDAAHHPFEPGALPDLAGMEGSHRHAGEGV
jgi:hypothetical protein